MSRNLRWSEHGLAFRQCVVVLSIVLVVFGLVTALFGLWLRNAMFAGMREEVRMRAEHIAGDLDLSFMRVSRTADAVAALLPSLAVTTAEMREIVQFTIQALFLENGTVCGGSIAILPEWRDEIGFGMWYVKIGADDVAQGREVDAAAEGGYWNAPWFVQPQRTLRGNWSEPYFDSIGQVLMTTYSAPIIETDAAGKRRFIGVFTVDISLKWLNEELIAGVRRGVAENSSFFDHAFAATEFTERFSDNCYAFLMSRSGQLVAHPIEAEVMTRPNGDEAPGVDPAAYRNAIQKLAAGSAAFEPFPYSQVFQSGAYVFSLPLRTADWTLALMVNHRMLYWELFFRTLAVVLLALSGALVAGWLVARVTFRALKPVEALSRAARRIGDGHFHEQLPEIRDNNEIAALGRALGDMQARLLTYFAQIEADATARARMDSELKLAESIQNSLLPQWRPEYAQNEHFGLAAYLKAARQVGGDLYDFYLTRDRRKLFLVIGDVSGKEISGALVMAVTQTLQRGYAAAGLAGPGAILTRVNEELGRNNDSMMFVTLFMACLDLESGVLTYCNAGHNPPYLVNASGIRAHLTELHGPPLGVAEVTYAESSIPMSSGDTLFLYTDGVTEAENGAQRQFGVAALEVEMVRSAPLTGVQARLDAVVEKLEEFRAGAVASDDTTLLLMEFVKTNTDREQG